MKRPPLFTATRRQYIDYIEYLEGQLRVLTDVEGIQPGARGTDPSTSKRAATLAHPRVGTHRFRVLEVLALHADRGGLTSEEIGLMTGINGVWKRCSELHDGGFAYTEGERKTLSGDDARIYHISSKGRLALSREKQQKSVQA